MFHQAVAHDLYHPVQDQTGQVCFRSDPSPAYVVPFVETGEKMFLKTIFPSRKYTKRYLSKGSGLKGFRRKETKKKDLSQSSQRHRKTTNPGIVKLQFAIRNPPIPLFHHSLLLAFHDKLFLVIRQGRS